MSILLSDVFLEVARALILATIVAYLIWIGRQEDLARQPGWSYILSGFGLVLFAATIDITDNFEGLNRYVFVGDTEYQALLEKVFGFLGGLCLLALGFWKWLPEIAARRRAEVALRDSHDELQIAYAALQKRNLQFLDAQAQAVTDSLTGLPNNRAFLERIGCEVALASEQGSSLSLIMLDIDGFKVVNDTLGHLVGDEILCTVAGTLKAETGEGHASRHGGDEFSILLPGLTAREATMVAEQVREAVECSTANHESKVTISAGVVSFPELADSADQLLYRADSAMYWAKSAGKNRVERWRQPAALDAVR